MKYLLTLITVVFSSVLIAQDVNMQTATVSQCGGVFYDSGGEFGNYGNDESFVLTICPENPGQRIILDFMVTVAKKSNHMTNMITTVTYLSHIIITVTYLYLVRASTCEGPHFRSQTREGMRPNR